MKFASDPLLRSLRTAMRGHLHGAAAGSSWTALRKLKALALDAPLEAGGMGLGLAAGCAVAEELGRAALPGRYLAVAMAIDAAAMGDRAPDDLIGRLVGGELAVCLAGFESPGRGLVLDDPEADHLLAPVGDALVLLRRDTLDIRSAKDPSGAAEVATFAPAGTGTALCGWDATDQLAEGVVGRARIRQAAYVLGHAHGALACAAGYTTRRRQFGQALRDFQGVGSRLANAYVLLEASRMALARAIWLADGDQRFGLAAAEVLAQAAETASETAHVAMQMCGVRGMTAELAVMRHYVQIRREATRLGRPADLWRAVGRARITEAWPTGTMRSVDDPSGVPAVGP